MKTQSKIRFLTFMLLFCALGNTNILQAENGPNEEYEIATKLTGVSSPRVEVSSSIASSQENSDADDDEEEEPVDPDETAALTLNVTDTNQYGSNYGRNQNTIKLDATFTPITGRNHTLSWQAFDIEFGEMDVYLNNTKIKSVAITSNNRLGARDSVTVPSSNLISGANTLSFRVSGGDETWGITKLLVETLPDVGDGEPASVVLLDAPGKLGYVFGGDSHTHNFDFSFKSRGLYYQETIRINFDGYISHGGENGFEVLINGNRILYIPSYIGKAKYKSYSVTISKSSVPDGNNTLTIRPTKTHIYYSREIGVSNVKIVTHSIPLQDLAIVPGSLTGKMRSNNSIALSATVSNLSAKTSIPDVISFYIGDNSAMDNATIVASLSVPAITAGRSQIVNHSSSSEVNLANKFLRACITGSASDVDSSNNCSPTVQIDAANIVITPILLMLND